MHPAYSFNLSLTYWIMPRRFLILRVVGNYDPVNGPAFEYLFCIYFSTFTINPLSINFAQSFQDVIDFGQGKNDAVNAMH